jgi:hypothetical protein
VEISIKLLREFIKSFGQIKSFGDLDIGSKTWGKINAKSRMSSSTFPYYTADDDIEDDDIEEK